MKIDKPIGAQPNAQTSKAPAPTKPASTQQVKAPSTPKTNAPAPAPSKQQQPGKSLTGPSQDTFTSNIGFAQEVPKGTTKPGPTQQKPAGDQKKDAPAKEPGKTDAGVSLTNPKPGDSGQTAFDPKAKDPGQSVKDPVGGNKPLPKPGDTVSSDGSAPTAKPPGDATTQPGDSVVTNPPGAEPPVNAPTNPPPLPRPTGVTPPPAAEAPEEAPAAEAPDAAPAGAPRAAGAQNPMLQQLISLLRSLGLESVAVQLEQMMGAQGAAGGAAPMGGLGLGGLGNGIGLSGPLSMATGINLPSMTGVQQGNSAILPGGLGLAPAISPGVFGGGLPAPAASAPLIQNAGIQGTPAPGPIDEQKLLQAAGGDQQIVATLKKIAQDPEGAKALQIAMDKGTTFKRGELAGNVVGLTETGGGQGPRITLEDPTNVDTAAHELAHAAFPDMDHKLVYQFGHDVAARLGEKVNGTPAQFRLGPGNAAMAAEGVPEHNCSQCSAAKGV